MTAAIAPGRGRRARAVVRGLAPLGLVLFVACGGQTPGTPDDASVADAAPDAEPVDYCPLDVTDTAEATGHSPLGPIDMPLAWIGIFGGECGGMRAVLVPDRQTFEEVLVAEWDVEVSGARDALVIVPRNWDYDNGGWLNTGEMLVYHHVAGQTVEATGLITITGFTGWTHPPDPPDTIMLEATFVVDATGWSVTGWIEGIHCANLDVFCV